MKRFVLIVGGGSGTRMGADIPKQFMDINGQPVILRSAQAFLNYSTAVFLIFVVPKDHLNTMKMLCSTQGIENNFIITEGGPTRFHSVKSGLRYVDDPDAVVAIHDSVRPLISIPLIERCFHTAHDQGTAIPVIPVTDSVRMRDGALNRPVDRDSLVLVQTPQCFKASVIQAAYQVAYDEKFTDDASVAENAGVNLCLVEGERDNIKITTPSDLIIARAILQQR